MKQLTFDLEKQRVVLGAAVVIGDSQQVDAGVLQPQVQQHQGAIGVRLHSAAVVGRHVSVRCPLLPGGHSAAGQPWHEGPEDGGGAGAAHVHREEDIILHWANEAPAGNLDGDEGTYRKWEKEWERVKAIERGEEGLLREELSSTHRNSERH